MWDRFVEHLSRAEALAEAGKPRNDDELMMRLRLAWFAGMLLDDPGEQKKAGELIDDWNSRRAG